MARSHESYVSMGMLGAIAKWSKQTYEQRFWGRVDVKSEDECWVWLRGLSNRGYGKVTKDGKCTGAHRVSYEISKGKIPDGLCVLHKCDNPACVNPHHLFLGTLSDNIQDSIKKGRFRKGYHPSEYRPRGYAYPHGFPVKLTPEIIDQIKSLTQNGERQIDIAKKFGIDQSTVSRVINNLHTYALLRAAGKIRSKRHSRSINY